MVYTLSKPSIKSVSSVNQTEHLLKKQFPKRHEHYILEDFFCFNQNQGHIVDWNDARNILVTEDFIIGLVEGLDQEVGIAASSVMYNISSTEENQSEVKVNNKSDTTLVENLFS